MSIARLKNPDPRRCPLCGNFNDCGVAAGQESCWCFTEAVPPEILRGFPLRRAESHVCADAVYRVSAP